MADNGRWFKLWTSSLDDPSLGNLDISDWGRWAKFGAYLKAHGTNGVIELSEPMRILRSYMQIDATSSVIDVLMKFPNCTVTPVTNSTVTYRVEWQNWQKYQGDFSGDRVKRFRAKNMNRVTPKKRREEKRIRREDTTPIVPSEGTADSPFDQFWKSYPKKVGKGAAKKAWNRNVHNGDYNKIKEALSWQMKSDQWTKDGGQFVPMPSTYLNQHRWLDEPDTIITTQPDDNPFLKIIERQETERRARMQR